MAWEVMSVPGSDPYWGSCLKVWIAGWARIRRQAESRLILRDDTLLGAITQRDRNRTLIRGDVFDLDVLYGPSHAAHDSISAFRGQRSPEIHPKAATGNLANLGKLPPARHTGRMARPEW
jgi:hypothetical protein